MKNLSAVKYIIPLEKFNLNLGYITGNVFVLSHRANTMKSDAKSWHEIQLIVNWMKKIEKKLNSKSKQFRSNNPRPTS